MRRTPVHGAWIACSIIALVVGSGPQVAAQATMPSQEARTATFSGTITDTDPLTVTTAEQDQRLTPASNVTVTRNGKAATLADLRPGDRVTVTVMSDGTAVAIVATTNGGVPSWLSLALIVLIIIIMLILYFWLKHRQRSAPPPDLRSVRRPR